MAGNWGLNTQGILELPADYFEWLRDLNVDWVGISVALHTDDALDSTVERKYSGVRVPTYTDEALSGAIGALRKHGFGVYLTLAFENWEADQAEHPVSRGNFGNPDYPLVDPRITYEFWPWDPEHPDHERFVHEFFQTYTEQAVHFGKIARTEGVGLYSLGTETDQLFRSRGDGVSQWPNDYGEELRAMVAAVREVYPGLLTYDMAPSALIEEDFYGPGSDYLWSDLSLDVIGLSGYFSLVGEPPARVFSVPELETQWERIFRDYLIPLRDRNPGKPILFTEFGDVDSVNAPQDPNADLGRVYVFADSDGNGLDDGEETQANIIRALFNVMDRHPGLVTGAFPWDNFMANNRAWEVSFGQLRWFAIRSKLAEETVRERYAQWRE